MDSSPERRPTEVTRVPTGQVVLVAVLILIPIVALMWVSSYAKREPELWGFPFFYWYQFCWVFAAAILTSIAYRIVVMHERRRVRPPSQRTAPTSQDDGSDR
jgi:membrane protein implicated in regulation of membrane protease activity